jgi:hypothetical protein
VSDVDCRVVREVRDENNEQQQPPPEQREEEPEQGEGVEEVEDNTQSDQPLRVFTTSRYTPRYYSSRYRRSTVGRFDRTSLNRRSSYRRGVVGTSTHNKSYISHNTSQNNNNTSNTQQPSTSTQCRNNTVVQQQSGEPSVRQDVVPGSGTNYLSKHPQNKQLFMLNTN